MYFHPPSHIYFTFFNEDVIALNLQKDQYIIISKKFSETIFLALNYEFTICNATYFLANKEIINLPNDFNDSIKSLKRLDLLSKVDYDFPFPKSLEKKPFSPGADNIDWRMTNEDPHIKIPIWMAFEAYYSLIKVYFTLKIFGFYSLISSIKKRKKTYTKIKDPQAFKILVAALNACGSFILV